VEELRRTFPHDTPFHVEQRLESGFRRTITLSGASTGAVAAAPGVGLPLAVGATGVDMLAVLTAAGTYVLGTASLHGVALGELDAAGMERRRTLLFGVLLGNSGSKLILNTVQRTGTQWARAIAGSLSMQVLRELNRRLGGLLLRKLAPALGALAVARLVPMGIGAALGGGGNYFLASQIIASTHDAFGDAPAQWSEDVADHARETPDEAESSAESEEQGSAAADEADSDGADSDDADSDDESADGGAEAGPTSV